RYQCHAVGSSVKRKRQGQGASAIRVRDEGRCRYDRLSLVADAGYRGHNAPTDYKFRAYTSGQKRRLTRCGGVPAIEPVISHLKAEHRVGRNYLVHHAGDAVNAMLAAAGYNFHLLLRWLELLLSRFLATQKAAAALQWV